MTLDYQTVFKIIMKFKCISLPTKNTIQLENPDDSSVKGFDSLIEQLKSSMSKYKVYVNCEGIVFIKGEDVTLLYDYVLNTITNTYTSNQYYFKNGALFLK